jgi:hypothetical protein
MAEPPLQVFWFRAPSRPLVPPRPAPPHPATPTSTLPPTTNHFKDFAAKSPRSGSVSGDWLLRGCNTGLLLLSYDILDGEELTVYDPIERTSAFLRRPNSIQFDFHNEFRVFVVKMLSGRINQTGEWTALPSPSPQVCLLEVQHQVCVPEPARGRTNGRQH